MTVLQFLLIGLGIGSVYAALGAGLVLTYQATGVLNVAIGAIATYGAFTYAGLVSSAGVLILPIGRLDVGTQSQGAALLIAVGVTAILGLLSHLLIFRWLGTASGLSRLVAAVGLLLVVQALCTLRFAGVTAPAGIIHSSPAKIGSIRVPQDRLWLAAIVLIVVAVIAAVMRFTRVGIATRASAEDESAASLLGWNPLLLGALAWSVSSGLACLLGILAINSTGLEASAGTLLVVPSLAAALLGRLTSYFATAIGALVIGAVQSELTDILTRLNTSWLPQTGIKNALPFLVIVVSVAALGGRIPTRGKAEDPRLPPVPRGRPKLAVTVGCAAVVGVAMWVSNDIYRGALITSAIAAVVMLSIVLLTGMVGQISLAQMTFAGAGGFTLSLLAVKAHVPPVVAPLCAVLVATALGALAGLPSLRVRGVSLGIVTIGLGVVVSSLWFQNPSWTGGLGGSRIPQLSAFGLHIGSGTDLSFGLTCVVIVTALFLGVGALRGTALGAQMLLVRTNERAAAATGISTARVKLIAFAVSAAIAGVGGVLLGYQQSGVSFQDYDVAVSLVFVAIVYVSGVTSLAGAVIAGALAPGGIVFTVVQNHTSIGKYETLISAVALLVQIVVAPAGIAGSIGARLTPLRARLGAVSSPKGVGHVVARRS